MIKYVTNISCVIITKNVQYIGNIMNIKLNIKNEKSQKANKYEINK